MSTPVFTNVINQMPYLRTSREFPEEIKGLAFHVSKSYIEIANGVNDRIISIHSINRPAVNGEAWFLQENLKQQGFRQEFTFSTFTVIPHGINTPRIYLISPKSYGSFTDGTNFYGIIYGSSTAIPGQVTFWIDPVNINFVIGAGAPAITQGLINLEWISQP